MGCSAFSSRNSPFNEFLEASLYNLLFYILLFHQDSFLSPESEDLFLWGFWSSSSDINGVSEFCIQC